MSSKTVKEKTEPEEASGNWQPTREYAPSVLREDELGLGRVIGFCGLGALVLGGFALFLYQIGMASHINPFFASVLVVFGLCGLVFHASQDADQQIRRIYISVGFLCLVAGIIVTALPLGGSPGTQFLPWGFLFFLLALLFLLPSVRLETDPNWRQAAVMTLGAGGVIMALFAFIRANVTANYLLPYDMLVAILGLGYWWAFVGLVGTDDDRGYRAGVGLGLLGAIVILVAVIRSAGPPLMYYLGWSSQRPIDSYFAAGGLLLMLLGLVYCGVSAGLVSDNRLVVMTRRELSSFFYSPMVYIVLFASLVIGLIQTWNFVSLLLASARERVPLFEPIVQNYFIDITPTLLVPIIGVPLITMRLFSEEKRSGTLEVMLTAPLEELSIVMSKFLAALLFFLVLWVPWALFLVGLRALGGSPFDYRPLISFFLALVCSGAGFVAMGLFFSCLTRNQIAAAILTAMGMILPVGLFILSRQMTRQSPPSVWQPIFTFVNFVEFWIMSLTGKLGIREAVFQVSTAVFWLFLTVKVLESRKWR